MSATICSLLPFDLVEVKPGLTPTEFTVKKAEGDKPALTVIHEGVFYLVNPDPLADAKDVRNIKVPVPALELAQSIINDRVSAMLEVEYPDIIPGVWAVPGEYEDLKEFSRKYIKEITTYRLCQNNWFRKLVFKADDTWAKTKSPLAITDLNRYACDALGLKREWSSIANPEDVLKCPFCMNPIISGAIKCPTCHEVLDKVRHKELLGV